MNTKKTILGLALSAFVLFGAFPAHAALDVEDLAVASVGSGALPTIWTYETDDDVTDLDVSGYWGTAPAQMKAGDFIMAKCADGGATVHVTAVDQDAGTSTAAIVGSGGNGGIVWQCSTGAAYGTAGAVGYTVAPVAGTVTKAWHVVTTATNADVALNLDNGGTNMTGTITVTNADGAGTIDTATISANNTVAAGDAIKLESDGAGDTGAGQFCFNIVP